MKATITGDSELLRALSGLEKAGLDTTPAMEVIALRWGELAKMGFRNSTNPYGSRWAPVRRGGKPLRDTGRLQRSLTHRSTRKTAAIGTNVCYAIVHQGGATIKASTNKHASLCGYQTKGAGFLRFQIGNAWVTALSVKIPQRAIFPDKALGGLPRTWEDDAAGALISHLQSSM